MDYFEYGNLKEEYKSWAKTFSGPDDQLLARRFGKGQVIAINKLGLLSNVLSDYFKHKPPMRLIEFVLIPKSEGYELELIDESDESYIDASVYAIPCIVFTQTLERVKIIEPICLTAQSLGFAWRTDKKPIMEVFDILFELNDSSLE